MSSAAPRLWFARVVATMIGIVAAADLLFNGFGWAAHAPEWSFTFLLAAFAGLCSLAGVVAAIGMWIFQRWGWWIASWYCVFSVLDALAPYIVLGGRAQDDVRLMVWLLIVAVSLGYLFTPSVRAAYRITTDWRAASLTVFGAACLCIVMLWGFADLDLYRLPPGLDGTDRRR